MPHKARLPHHNRHRAIARRVIFGLAALIVALVSVSRLPAPALLPLAILFGANNRLHTPPPPTIHSPTGNPPSTTVAFTEWAHSRDEPPSAVGSGFLLQVSSGDIIGVTTAHSIAGRQGLTHIAFSLPHDPLPIARFEMTVGLPGSPRTGDDLTTDFVLLKLPAGQQIAPALALLPDERGQPQAGERVALYSGILVDGELKLLRGTVLSSGERAIWVLVDETIYPGGMSGSPLISLHTGQVVGMAIAVAARGQRYEVGFHPIASIVAKAQHADKFYIIDELFP